MAWRRVNGSGSGGGGGGGAAFTTIQTDAGTAPVATGATDTLTLTSTELDITGNSATDTVTLAMKNSAVINKVLTGYTSGAGTVAATDTILQAIQKLNGNIAAKVTGPGAVTDNRIMFFDGTTGFLAKQFGVGVFTGYGAGDPYLTFPNTGGIRTSAGDVLEFGSGGAINLLHASAAHLGWFTDGSGNIGGVSLNKRPLDIASKQDIYSGRNMIVGSAALATNATNGFMYMATCPGVPSGTPTTYTGRAAFVYDSSNNDFYVYNGAWKKVTLA